MIERVLYRESKVGNAREALLTKLYHDYYAILVNFSQQLTHDKDLSEDIVQEAFSKILENATRFDGESGLRVYLYNTVRNMCINHLRRRHAQENYAQHVNRQFEEYKVNPDGEEPFISEEVYRLLFQKIDELPARQREVFLMCMEGRRNGEIAEALHISMETVKTQKRRAIASLREKLGKHGYVILALMETAIGGNEILDII